MVCALPRSKAIRGWIFLIGLAVPQLYGQGVDVSAKILVRASSALAVRKNNESPSVGNVVVWLSPLKPRIGTSVLPVRQTAYRLVQKDKMFSPHLLVVPTGASVQF